jgi:hypothetical protein
MNAMAAIAMAMPTLAAHPHPSWHCQVWQWPSSTSTSAAGRLRTPVLVSAQCHPRSRFSPFARPLITPAPHLHCHAVLPAPAPARQLLARAALDDSTMATQQDVGQSDGGVILLVGVTGGTGGSVVNGLLASGVDSSKLRVLTRSPQGAAARNLAAGGVQPISGDLDDPNSLNDVLKGRPGDTITCSKILTTYEISFQNSNIFDALLFRQE